MRTRDAAVDGFIKALSVGSGREDMYAFTEGTIEGDFGCGNLTITSHHYEWNTAHEMRAFVTKAAAHIDNRKIWKKHTVLSVRERFRGHIEIANPLGYTVVPEPVYTEWRWDHATIEAGSYYRTPGSKIIGWNAYDHFYLHRKPWKMKSDAHLDFLLASIGYRRG